ncbi:hypothetical protein PENCOP_c012G06067 [Penicillium coprophilum]|uniref:RlpA-like protein double-psi beta-barrel domain-containing protein n=1 Tax=Penicillium coprophilum TaxID=36646 RepID=A0A1V6UCA0_9EURO|nr:hypothetical protein PENCOP_c012G06067 [Penicillium coprophilum]
MAPITKTLALVGAFFALTGYSAPVAKRAVVWETVTDIVWTTVDVTVTVYPQATHTATVVPVVANAVTTTAAAVQQEKAAPTTTSATTSSTTTSSVTTSSSTTTAAAAPTAEALVKEQEKVVPTTTSSTAAPAPTVEAYSAPAPVVEADTTAPATSRTTKKETNTESTGSSGHTGACSEGSPCSGEITFYDTATTSTNPSSCGTTNDGTVENVLALPHGIMTDSDCGKTVTITYNGQTATGIVVDKCMGCDNGSVDLSRHLFGQLASMDKGRADGAKWYIH